MIEAKTQYLIHEWLENYNKKKSTKRVPLKDTSARPLLTSNSCLLKRGSFLLPAIVTFSSKDRSVQLQYLLARLSPPQQILCHLSPLSQTYPEIGW